MSRRTEGTETDNTAAVSRIVSRRRGGRSDSADRLLFLGRVLAVVTLGGVVVGPVTAAAGPTCLLLIRRTTSS